MTDTLRDKLIQKGWVTPFNADTLVRLIEEHYAELTKPVVVSERPWEREGWCDKHGQCWAFNKDLPAWEFLDHANSCKWADLFLPAHALPLPEVSE